MNEDHISLREHDHWNINLDRQSFTVKVFDAKVATTVTCKASVVHEWIRNINSTYHSRIKRKQLLVGLGVRWSRTSWSSKKKVATLQLSVGHYCLIFHIIHAKTIPTSLESFLSNGSHTFVGVRNYNDSHLLSNCHHLNVNRILELGSVADREGASMEVLAREILGFHGIKKPVRIARSKWDNWLLSRPQVQYACVDAHLSFRIGTTLRAWNYGRRP